MENDVCGIRWMLDVGVLYFLYNGPGLYFAGSSGDIDDLEWQFEVVSEGCAIICPRNREDGLCYKALFTVDDTEVEVLDISPISRDDTESFRDEDYLANFVYYWQKNMEDSIDGVYKIIREGIVDFTQNGAAHILEGPSGFEGRFGIVSDGCGIVCPKDSKNNLCYRVSFDITDAFDVEVLDVTNTYRDNMEFWRDEEYLVLHKRLLKEKSDE